MRGLGQSEWDSDIAYWQQGAQENVAAYAEWAQSQGQSFGYDEAASIAAAYTDGAGGAVSVSMPSGEQVRVVTSDAPPAPTFDARDLREYIKIGADLYRWTTQASRDASGIVRTQYIPERIGGGMDITTLALIGAAAFLILS